MKLLRAARPSGVERWSCGTSITGLVLLLHAARRTLLQQVVQARRRRRGILVLLRVHGQVGFGAAVCPMQTHEFIDALFGKDVLGLSAAAQQQQQQ